MQFDSILGRGAFKTVYKAFDESEGLEVAWYAAQHTQHEFTFCWSSLLLPPLHSSHSCLFSSRLVAIIGICNGQLGDSMAVAARPCKRRKAGS